MGVIQTKNFKCAGYKCKINLETYESAEEVVNDNRKRPMTSDRFHDMAHESMSKSFEGVDSYEEALELMRTGYQPTVDKLQEALKVSKKKGSIQKRIQFENNVHGFAPIVPLALKGVPNSMMHMTMKPIKQKVLNVYYDMTTSCGTTTNQIIKNGQKILEAILELERQGYRFNLYAVQDYWSDSDETGDLMCVKIKPSDKPFDLKRMSFPLTHPAFFRVIGFDWYSKCPVAKYRGGYGHAVAYDLDDVESRRQFGEALFGKGAIYLTIKDVASSDAKELKEVFLNDNSKNKQ